MTEESLLIQSGLSAEQSSIYETLLEKGPQKAGDISRWTGIKRGLVYKVLEQLDSLGLVQKRNGPGTIMVYFPSHPSRLVDMLEIQEKNIKLTKETVSSNLGTLLSQFNLNQDKPNVQFYEGIKGLERLWADIISEKTDIKLIQSPNDRHHPQVGEKILKQIEKQVANNIHTQAITPIVEDTFKWIKEMDNKNLVTRQIIPLADFNIPAQIILYGTNKIAVTSFGETIITTITEDIVTYQAFTIIFEFLWKVLAEKYLTEQQK